MQATLNVAINATEKGGDGAEVSARFLRAYHAINEISKDLKTHEWTIT